MSLFSRPIKLGILANEFLDPSIGRVGGFGWAARTAADVFEANPELGVEPVFLSGEHRVDGERQTTVSNGTRLVLRRRGWRENYLALARERIDIILTIEYRPSYDALLWAQPTTPVIVWVRDPHTPADNAKIFSLRVPGGDGATPAGLWRVNSRRLSKIAGWSRLVRRPVLLANKMAYLRAKNQATYDLPPSDLVLPNPDVIDYKRETRPKGDRASVVFLGRLDPIKRPWLFIELARRIPDVEFLMLGTNHQAGRPGAWQPEDVPTNVRMLGHVSGREKVRLLERALVLVNTSIHEESPVSVLEALACQTPPVTYEDWGDIVQRFGTVIGQHPGDGVAGLDALESAVRRLLHDEETRRQLGATGRSWVMQEHNTERFIESFAHIVQLTGRFYPNSTVMNQHSVAALTS